jgi:hypothetical protein
MSADTLYTEGARVSELCREAQRLLDEAREDRPAPPPRKRRTMKTRLTRDAEG